MVHRELDLAYLETHNIGTPPKTCGKLGVLVRSGFSAASRTVEGMAE